MNALNDFWSLNEGTFYCLYDEKRTLAFKKAIYNSVKQGDVVVELGAGSGILSMFAADAGARKVYAVELDGMNAKSLRESIKLNGYEGVIEVIEGDATTVQIPEKADVIICEMIATGLIEELQVPAMNNAQNFMTPNTVVLLKQYDIVADLVFEKNEFYEKKFHVVRYEFPDLDDLQSVPMSERKIVRSVDLSIENKENTINETFVLTAVKKGIVNGLRIGGDTTFSDNSTFDYSISYSFPAVFPVHEFSVDVGDKIKIDLKFEICGGPQTLSYSVSKL